jgi:hypothetical protein
MSYALFFLSRRLADPGTDDESPAEEESSAKAGGKGKAKAGGKGTSAESSQWIVADISGDTVTLMWASDCEKVRESKVASKQLLTKLTAMWDEASGGDNDIGVELNDAGAVCKLTYQGESFS